MIYQTAKDLRKLFYLLLSFHSRYEKIDLKTFTSAFTRLFYVSILVVLVVALSACSGEMSSENAANQDSFSIAPVFREFYDQIGGEYILGKPISPPVQEENFIYQYTVNAVLVKATNLSNQSDVLFSPIGLDLNLPLYTMKGPIQEGSYYVHDIAIYNDFIPLFQKLGGEARVGRPLTPLRYNPQKKRYEQLFEGVGFFFNEGDPRGTVKLLAYGAWKCQDSCIYPINKDAEVILPKPIDPHFQSFIEKYGSDFSGFALADASQTKDGRIEQVFENIALVFDPKETPQVYLVRIPPKLGILPQDLVNKTNEDDQVFIPLSGEKGHHVLRDFMDYLNLHGGLEVVGSPINEATMVGNQTIWQCFETICLEKDGRIDGIYQIHPSALGLEYLYLNNPPGASNQGENIPQPQTPAKVPNETNAIVALPTNTIEIELIQSHAWVDSSTPQEIKATITQNRIPLEGLKPYLVILRPDGEPIRFPMPPTDVNGVSTGKIPAISAPNGTLINYKVCIQLNDLPEQCASGVYPIWKQP